jgi:hypothetical protein
MAALQVQGPASFPQERATPLRPTQPRPHPLAPSRWPPVAPREAPFGPSRAPRSPARVPRLSPRFITTMKALTSRCASTQPFGLCLIARSTPPALRPHPGGMNTVFEDATRSPQVRRPSVPPCCPHTPCLGARSAGISFAVRLPARISALMADRFAMASASAAARRFDASPSDSILRWTPCPPRGTCHEAAGICPASCLRIPPARVRRDFHPQEKRPAGRTALIRKWLTRQEHEPVGSEYSAEPLWGATTPSETIRLHGDTHDAGPRAPAAR